jgi:uncharacterized protein YerC
MPENAVSIDDAPLMRIKLPEAFLHLTSAAEVQSFLGGILARHEILHAERRWEAIQLLLEGKPQRKVAKIANLSIASVSRAARSVRTNFKIFRQILSRELWNRGRRATHEQARAHPALLTAEPISEPHSPARAIGDQTARAPSLEGSWTSSARKDHPSEFGTLQRCTLDAIIQWGQMRLPQKELAYRARVSASYISHLQNDGHAAPRDVTDRIVKVVTEEKRNRIEWLPMEVVAFCHDQPFKSSTVSHEELIRSVKATLAGCDSQPCELAEEVKGVLFQIGDPGSNSYLITLGPLNNEDMRRAVAHELQHLIDIVLQGVRRPSSAAHSASGF